MQSFLKKILGNSFLLSRFYCKCLLHKARIQVSTKLLLLKPISLKVLLSELLLANIKSSTQLLYTITVAILPILTKFSLLLLPILY